MFAWFGVHMSSKGEQWRDCIISGGWQVLACEVLGAANGLVLVLRPVRTSSPPPLHNPSSRRQGPHWRYPCI